MDLQVFPMEMSLNATGKITICVLACLVGRFDLRLLVTDGEQITSHHRLMDG